jgi:hypothetical protein
VFVLVTHMLANVRDNVLTVVCERQPSVRDRDAEFAATAGAATELQEQWRDLRAQIVEALASIPPGDLSRPRDHRWREDVNGRDVLLFTARHVAEHIGHAELTRDLRKAIGPG